eukprot:jgi/Mesvir1/25484/Mv01744-RA.1
MFSNRRGDDGDEDSEDDRVDNDDQNDEDFKEEVIQLSQEQRLKREERLRERMQVSVYKIAETEAEKAGVELSKEAANALAGLTFKFTELLARDLEQFAHHAGRKSVSADDVILAARRAPDVRKQLEAVAARISAGKRSAAEDKQGKGGARANKRPPVPPGGRAGPSGAIEID